MLLTLLIVSYVIYLISTICISIERMKVARKIKKENSSILNQLTSIASLQFNKIINELHKSSKSYDYLENSFKETEIKYNTYDENNQKTVVYARKINGLYSISLVKGYSKVELDVDNNFNILYKKYTEKDYFLFFSTWIYIIVSIVLLIYTISNLCLFFL